MAAGREHRRGSRETAAPRIRRVALLIVRAVGALALAALLAWGAVVSWAWLRTSDRLAVSTLVVEGVRRADATALLRNAGLEEGGNIFSVDLAGAVLAIEADTWVASASVSRELPSTLRVRVVEHEPVALVVLGALYAATSDGLLFRRIQPGDGLDLPLVTGLGEDVVQGENLGNNPGLSTALAVIEAWSRLGLSELAALSEVQVDRTGGEITWSVWTGEPAVEIRLGALAPDTAIRPVDASGATDLELRLSRVAQVLNELDRRRLHARVIDAGNRKQPELVAARID